MHEQGELDGRLGEQSSGGVSAQGLERGLLRYAWLPVPLFLIAMVAIWLLELSGVFEPPYLIPVLNLIFRTAVAILVVVFAARSFARNGGLPPLLLGCGLMFFGLGSLVSGLAIPAGMVNVAVTVHNSTFFLAGLCHVVAVAGVCSARVLAVPYARVVLIGAYSSVFVVVLLLTLLALTGVTPPFYIEGPGSTLIRDAVLSLSVAFFAVSALLLLISSRRQQWRFGEWYGLALALIATGLLTLLLTPNIGGPLGWVGRSAQYVGGLYLLGAVIAAARQDGEWDAPLYDAWRESEERFRTLVEATREGVVISEGGTIIDANEQAGQILGRDREALIGAPVAGFVPPEWREEVMRRITTGSEEVIEHPAFRRDGSRIFLEVHGRTMRRRGRTLRFSAIRDVTRRKNQEEALRESEHRFRDLFENMSEGFLVGEPLYDEAGQPKDFRVLMVNNAFERQTGLGAEIVGKPVKTFLPHLEQSWIDTYAGVARSGEPVRFENFNRDTGRHYEAFCYRPTPGRFAVLFNDITTRKKAGEALLEAKAKNERSLAQLDAIINQMTEGLVIFDAEGHLVRMNQAALRIHGFEDDDALRRHLEQLTDVFEVSDLDGNPLPTERWPIGRALAGETFQSYEVRVRRPDTEDTWIGSYGGAPVYDEKQNRLCAIVTLRDITAQKLADQELKRSRDELEERVRERTAELKQRADQLARLTSELTLAEQRERRRLAQVLHDHLQQLLVAAKISLDVLTRKLSDREQKNVARIVGLLDESIEASRSLTVELSPPILHEAGLGPALKWLARWVEEKHGLSVSVAIDEEVVVTRDDLCLLLFQSAKELLLNTAKHARVDKATVELAGHGERFLRITVADSGAGFDPGDVFDRPEEVKGGFGLFSIRERLELLGGKFVIESSPGSGARFTLLAPRQRKGRLEGGAAVVADRLLPSDANTPARQAGSSGRIRLMLVDDHAVVRQGLCSLLEQERDIEIVAEAADGREAIELARRLQPDVILMDFSLPQTDGVEATRVIHGESPQIQIIGLSMYEEADRAEAMLDAGAAGYISKSGVSDVLLETIRQVAGNDGVRG